VVIKVSVVLFVLALGSRYISAANWGSDWHSFAPFGFSGIGAGAAYIFFAYIGFDAVSTTAQEARIHSEIFDWHHRVLASLHGALHRSCWRSYRHGSLAGREH
jgi:uncharacterized membrane protein